MSHLLKRIDLNAELGFNDFKVNEASLDNQPIMFMSELTTRLLNSIDVEFIKEKRNENFIYLHNELSSMNLLPIKIDERSVPMIYPFRTKNQKLKNKLIENKIYCATYWPNVIDWSMSSHNSYQLTNEIIALPIDQRYSETEMRVILDCII